MAPQPPAAFSRLALCLWAAASAAALPEPAVLVGDAAEYAVMFLSWTRHLSPGVQTADLDAYNHLIHARPVPGSVPVTPRHDPFLELPGVSPPVWDLRHFWFYSFLASPFLLLAQIVGLHPLASFALLHSAMGLCVVLLARRWSGPAGALAAALTLAASPALWYANKIHTEPLTICSVLAGFIASAAARPAWGALLVSLGAAQNNLLAPLAAAMLATAWFSQPEQRPLTLRLGAACAALIGLAPAFYWSRHGFTNPISALGYVQPELLSSKRLLSIWIDPDRGLLLLWPLALPCLAAALARITGRSFLSNPILLTAAFYAAYAQAVMCMQGNWNSGASHLVQRYSVWFIPLAWFPLRGWLQSAWTAPPARRAASLALLSLLAAWSAFQFRPSQPDTVVQFNALSRWWYSNLPSLLDPEPEIFLERACQSELRGFTAALLTADCRALHHHPPHAAPLLFWAASDPSCRKLFVSAEGLSQARALPQPPPIAGCSLPRDLQAALSQAARLAPAGRTAFYMTLPR